jgi:hypothetical protein
MGPERKEGGKSYRKERREEKEIGKKGGGNRDGSRKKVGRKKR